jgi:translation elongation factor EF-Ts
VSEEDVPADLDAETRAQVVRDRVLLTQRYQATNQTVNDLLKEAVGTLGENIQVSRFSRFVLGGK